MTLKEFAERLNGTEYNGYPIFSKEDIGIAKENGFVIVTGASDDLMEFEGAIEDEAGCFDGGRVYISKNGVEEDKTKNVINMVYLFVDCQMPVFSSNTADVSVLGMQLLIPV